MQQISCRMMARLTKKQQKVADKLRVQQAYSLSMF